MTYDEFNERIRKFQVIDFYYKQELEVKIWK